MAPFYGLRSTNTKKYVSNLLKCQQTFYNSSIYNVTLENPIRYCNGSVYNTNSGLIDFQAIALNMASSTCCAGDQDYEGKLFNSQGNSANVPFALRYSTYLKSARGGRNIFVFNNRNPFIVNYLGKIEGQIGGSGMPPRNQLI
jgi:hypothetical protein